MVDFIVENWQFLVTAVISLAVFLIQIFKKQVKVQDTALTDTLTKLPEWIQEAEKRYKDGKAKKIYVVQTAINYYSSINGNKALQDITQIISDTIETILSTPTKKEVE